VHFDFVVKRARGARSNSVVSNPARYQVACVLAALLLFVPIISALQGCGGGASSAPLVARKPARHAQRHSILTLTPSANSNSGKALQLSPIQRTLVMN
jgi:hypothetical protein